MEVSTTKLKNFKKVNFEVKLKLFSPQKCVCFSPTPEYTRPKLQEILENYSLADLQYVGTLEQDSLWALIRAPDSTIHRVQIGNYMGMNHGQIVAISETQLTLKEIVPEGNGYNERETTVPVVEIN